MGLVQFGTPHFDSPSGALRLGHTIDARGRLRAAVVGSVTGVDLISIGGTVLVEYRPLNPGRITPLVAGGGGVLHSLDYPGATHGIGLAAVGVAVRVGPRRTVTLRAQYGDSYKAQKFYSLHVGFEIGR